MSNKFAGWKQTSYSYNEGWKALNEAVFLGTFHALSSSHPIERNNNGDYKRILRVKAPHGLDTQDVVAVFCDTFDQSCRCEHDCCGCLIVRVGAVSRIRRREWRVTLHYSRNY